MLILRSRTEGSAPAEGFPCSPLLASLLAARGVRTAEEAERFLHPSADQLTDPYALDGMREAVALIRQTVSAGSPVVVYGDYDVDGCCAVAILTGTLRALGAEADWYIPSRREEGYGLNPAAVGRLAPRYGLMITVDCGITSVEEAELARELGLPLIITDHHEPGPRLPQAAALIDPKLGRYPFAQLCGAGVAFKIAQALRGDAALDMLELAALATVADMVPLLGENRVIAALGMRQMEHTRRPGLRALLAVSGIEGTPLNTGHLGFRVAPRLNAGGRLGDADRSVRLLMTDDPAEAAAIAEELDGENTRRQELEARVVNEASAWAEAHTDFLRDRIIIAAGDGWDSGVAGLAASRLTERFGWPSVVLTRRDGLLTGSGRSIAGVNLHRALSLCADLFLRFGGHAQAAGMTLAEDRLDELRVRLNRAVAEVAEPDAFLPRAAYDLELRVSDATHAFVRELELLAPTGLGNPAPVFWLRGLRMLQTRAVGREGQHLKVRLEQEGRAIDGIGFSMAAEAAGLPAEVDALAELDENDWMGRSSVELKISRLFASDEAGAFLDACGPDVFAQAVLRGVWPRTEALPESVLRLRVREALSRDAQGTALAVYTPEGARTWVRFLREEGFADRIDYCVGRPSDSRGFNLLCAAPEEGALDGYRQVIELDAGLAPAALAAWLPDDGALRGLYRTLRGAQGPLRSLAELAQLAGMTPAAVRTGLDVFEELGLLRWTDAPFGAELLAPQKTSLENSSLLTGLRGKSKGGRQA